MKIAWPDGGSLLKQRATFVRQIFQGPAKNIPLTWDMWHIPDQISARHYCSTAGHYNPVHNAIAAFKVKKGYFYYFLFFCPPSGSIFMFMVGVMLQSDIIIAPRSFVQSGASFTALTTSINNIKSNIIIGSYCDSDHIYISQISRSAPLTLYNTLQKSILSVFC